MFGVSRVSAKDRRRGSTPAQKIKTFSKCLLLILRPAFNLLHSRPRFPSRHWPRHQCGSSRRGGLGPGLARRGHCDGQGFTHGKKTSQLGSSLGNIPEQSRAGACRTDSARSLWRSLSVQATLVAPPRRQSPLDGQCRCAPAAQQAQLWRDSSRGDCHYGNGSQFDVPASDATGGLDGVWPHIRQFGVHFPGGRDNVSPYSVGGAVNRLSRVSSNPSSYYMYCICSRHIQLRPVQHSTCKRALSYDIEDDAPRLSWSSRRTPRTMPSYHRLNRLLMVELLQTHGIARTSPSFLVSFGYICHFLRFVGLAAVCCML